MNHLDRLLTAIANEHLGIATLETRQSDALDFHEVSVWGLKHALAASYQAGASERTARPGATPAGHTPEPWYVDGLAGNETQLWIRTLERPIAIIPLGKDPEGDRANACRLVACVNACAGIATTALESGVLREMVAALQWFEGAWRRWAEDIRRFPKLAANCELFRIYEAARAVLARVGWDAVAQADGGAAGPASPTAADVCCMFEKTV